MALGMAACAKEGSNSLIAPGSTVSNSTGKVGSMARFAIVGDFLYTVDNHTLQAFNISDPHNIRLVKTEKQQAVTETIFAYEKMLLLGTRTGVTIYNSDDAGNLNRVREVPHVTSFDPVVANATHAYVTLRGRPGTVNRNSSLNVYDINRNAQLAFNMPMESPYGLSLDGDKLYVCDNGLKVMTLRDGVWPQISATYSNITGTDVLSLENSILVVGPTGIRQMSRTQDGKNMQVISTIPVIPAMN